MGHDYFRKDFRCNTDDTILSAKNPGKKQKLYIERYKFIRAVFDRDNRNRIKAGRSPFAVITGDSTTMLFVDPRLQEYVPGFDIANRGIAGDATYMLLKRVEADVVPLKPRVIIMVIGGNDLLKGRCVSAALADTRSVLKLLRKRLPNTRILIAGVPPVITWKANTIAPWYNRQVEYMASEMKGVEYMDLYRILGRRDMPGLKRDYYLSTRRGKFDAVHFNGAGYREWGKYLSRRLREIRAGK